MKESSKLRELMISVLYGEADRAARRRLESALEADPALAQEYRQLQGTLASLSRAELAKDPGVGFWDGVWAEFQRRERREAEGQEHEAKRPLWSGWSWKPALQFAVVAVMLVLGIFIGRMLGGEGRAPETAPVPAQAFLEDPISTVAYPYEREIEQRKQDYFIEATRSSLRRSESVINNFMELRQQTWESYEEAISRNRVLSRELLDEIVAIRSGFGRPIGGDLDVLLDELEVVISDIAIIEMGEMDRWPEIIDLQQGIAERDLLNRLKRVELRIIPLGAVAYRTGGVDR